MFGPDLDYGDSRQMTLYQLRIDQRVFVTPSNRKLDVNVVQSNYHIELTPS
jgi:hypothetical protein